VAARQSKGTGDPKLAVGYLRVSTDDQRLGPEAQRDAIQAWADREGIYVVAWHADQGVSGGSDLVDRPALVAALAELRTSRAGVLAVAKRDRLARDVYVASTIERAVAQCGARVASADGTANGDNPADQFMRSILDAAAAYERGLIRARTKAALAVKRARGERVGAVPYGCRLAEDGKAFTPDTSEQAAIAAARALRVDGWSYRRIRLELAARGMCGRTGRPFTLQATFAMLSSATKPSEVGRRDHDDGDKSPDGTHFARV
jgi:DNA invertase Pin-like site-specific DNA recombinase